MNYYFFDNRIQIKSVAVKSAINKSVNVGLPIIFENCRENHLNTNRGFLFGDGFFTTGIIDNGLIRHLSLHRQRLDGSAKRLQFANLIADDIFEVVQQKLNNIAKACIRITISRIQEQRGYAFATNSSFDCTVQISDLPKQPKNDCELIFAQTPISSNSLLAGLKHLNRLDNVMAAREVKLPHQESLMCHDDIVISGSRSNLFIFSQGHWLTPKLDNAGVNGITRQRLIKMMTSQKILIKQTQINKQQLIDCEAAFMTNSLVGLWPVVKIEDKPIATQLSQDLKSLLQFKR